MRAIAFAFLIVLSALLMPAANSQTAGLPPDHGHGRTSSDMFVAMSVAATPTNPPVIMGSTNLPDETILSVHLLGDPPACVPDCGLEYNAATVQNGRFTTTLKGPHPLISDSYTIDVAFFGPQSQNVQFVIGKLGEHLRGPYVVTFGPRGQYVPVKFPRDTPPSESEQIVGLMIHYTQKIDIAGNASSDAASRTQAITDFREWNVKSCTSNIDFVNGLVRSGGVMGSETLGAERQAKIDACTAEGEAQLQASLKSRQQSPAPMTNGLPQAQSVQNAGADVAQVSPSSNNEQTCSGEFSKLESGFYMIGGCNLSAANAKKVMKACALGQQCEITGTIEHCKDVRGACGEMTHITAMRWGKPLPPCGATAAAARADEWWSENSSVVARGTIVQSTKSDGEDTPPYGHMKIVMDLTTCSTGSPMAVDRVPERWIGHYVELNGTAIKGANGWYIISRSIKDAE